MKKFAAITTMALTLVLSGGTAAEANPGYRGSDRTVGILKDYRKVPCGGLWDYRFKGIPKGKKYLAREINCAGSARYLTIRAGERMNINGKKCRVVRAQNLNYRTNTTRDIRWQGVNIIVQTCYPRGNGKVRAVGFSCS